MSAKEKIEPAKGELFVRQGEQIDADALQAALTSKSPLDRIMGRAVAAGWPTAFTDWVNAELDRPDTEVTKLLHAIVILHVQAIAGICGQMMRPAGFAAAKGLVAKELDRIFEPHAMRCHVEVQRIMAQRRAAR